MAKTRTRKSEKSAKVAVKAATKVTTRAASKPTKTRRKAARTPDELKFIADVLTRGEACQPSASGTMPTHAMPPGTTHELVTRSTGTPGTPQTTQIKRRRFSAF